MDGQLGFPGADSGFAGFLPYNFPPLETNHELVEPFPVFSTSDQLFNFGAPFDSFESVTEVDWGLLSYEIPSEESAPPATRPRAATIGSQQDLNDLATAKPLASAKQAERRQNAKSNGQFRCHVKGCPRYGSPFGSSSDLRRHLAESHAIDPKGSFPVGRPCPWTSCTRADKVFKRQKNLDEHLAKKHGGQRPEVEDLATTISSDLVGASATSLSQSGTVVAPMATASQPAAAMSTSRARRADSRRQVREQMRLQIKKLRKNSSTISGCVAVARQEVVAVQTRLSHLQEAEKASLQSLQALEERWAEEFANEEGLEAEAELVE